MKLKDCGAEMQSLVAHLKDHKQKCKELESEQSDIDDNTVLPTAKLASGVMTTDEVSNVAL